MYQYRTEPLTYGTGLWQCRYVGASPDNEPYQLRSNVNVCRMHSGPYTNTTHLYWTLDVSIRPPVCSTVQILSDPCCNYPTQILLIAHCVLLLHLHSPPRRSPCATLPCTVAIQLVVQEVPCGQFEHDLPIIVLPRYPPSNRASQVLSTIRPPVPAGNDRRSINE